MANVVPPSTEPIIRWSHVSHRFQRSARPALSDISLDIGRGEFFAVIGGAGSGKSVLAQLTAGMFAPSTGTITIAGVATTHNHPAIQQQTNYLPQVAASPPFLTVLDLITTSGTLRGMPKREARSAAQDLLERAHVSELARNRFSTITTAQQQVVRCCSAFMGYPHLLILDEPTAHMDPTQRRWLWDLLKRLHVETGVSIMVTSQDIAEVERYASMVMLLNHGTVIALGTPTVLKEKFAPGPRMDVRLKPTTQVSAEMRRKLQAIGTLTEPEPQMIVLYPNASAIGSLAKSVPIPVPVKAKKTAKVGATTVTTSPSDLTADSWLLDSQPLPGSLGQTVEDIFAIIGRQQIVEFWFSPPTLTDVYLGFAKGN